ncbi:MAG: hypothetical protein ACRDDH_06190 [Cetobacterium sp.]|uniref:hypothetical protein n=1 Tax=Cetobacterium sp. TaxID=2071632 RepID=UPI003EE73263
MLLNTLQDTIEHNLQKKYNSRFSKEIISNFIQVVSMFDKEGCMSIYKISEYLKISETDSFILLSQLVKLNYLRPMYKIYCPKCHFTSKHIYSIEELGDSLICEECEHTVIDHENLLKYLTLMFQVI